MSSRNVPKVTAKKFRRKDQKMWALQSTWKFSWQYFEILHFLKNQFTAGTSTGNMSIAGSHIIVNGDSSSKIPEPHTLESNVAVVDDHSLLVNHLVIRMVITHLVIQQTIHLEMIKPHLSLVVR